MRPAPFHLLLLAGTRTAVLTAVAVVGAGSAVAASGLRLPPPTEFGERNAITYDDTGRAVGKSRLSVDRLASGNISLDVRVEVTGGARMEAHAELAPVPGSNTLMPLYQRSQSHDASGRPLDILEVHHGDRVATCTSADGEQKPRVKLLPKDDRVVNVPLALLFQPLARGETESAEFQLFLCGSANSTPRIVDMKADVKQRGSARVTSGNGTPKVADSPDGDGVDSMLVRAAGTQQSARQQNWVEVEYFPSMPWVPRSLLPKYSFWFDGEGAYLAHRIPLYSEGPEVIVVSGGVGPRAIEATR